MGKLHLELGNSAKSGTRGPSTDQPFDSCTRLSDLLAIYWISHRRLAYRLLFPRARQGFLLRRGVFNP